MSSGLCLTNKAVAFVSTDTSVSLCKDLAGRWRLWLTRESGRGPGSGVSCVRHAWSSPGNLRKSYLVVQYDCAQHAVLSAKTEVAVSQLCEESFDAWREGRRNCVAGANGVDLSRFLVAVSQGAHARCCGSGSRWDTGAVRGCMSCEGFSSLERRRFVRQDKYCGTYPFGRLHWFRGVTDAVHSNSGWLRFGYCRSQYALVEDCVECNQHNR